MKELTGKNISALDRIIDYNAENGIGLFRISSDIIPFGSHPSNPLDWKKEYARELCCLGKKIKDAGLRVSMHPGQYTVLNSGNPAVVENALLDIEYHADFLDALKTGPSSKIVLHVGGAYGDKENAARSFINNFSRLQGRIRQRIVLENDDRNYTVRDVLEICGALEIPAVFDNLHHRLNPPEEKNSEREWIRRCRETWRENDGLQKIHYSQPGERHGAHSRTIDAGQFLEFYNSLPDPGIDIMLEVKDKNCSAIKCMHAASGASARELEPEWARYKYLVLSRSASIYNGIREMLKMKEQPAAVAFYGLTDRARSLPESIGAEVNAAQHVWGYFKDCASDAEKGRFERLLNAYRSGKARIAPLKRYLFQCAQKYELPYLLHSYYFYLP